MKLETGGHVQLRAPEGGQQLPDLGVISPQGPSAAVYLTGAECLLLADRLHEMGLAYSSDDRSALYALALAVRARSKDSRYCIVCMADALDNSEGFDHEEDCPLRKLDEAAVT